MTETLSYTPEDLAKILKITRYTVYEMIKRGDFPAYRIGRKVRVEAPDLEAYIKKSKGSTALFSAMNEKSEDTPSVNPDEIVLCGQDALLDTLTRHMQGKLPNVRLLRNYIGSIDGLMALYHGKVNAVTTHLWDSDTDTYNTSFVRRIMPGHRTLIINLVYRMEGFYVIKDGYEHEEMSHLAVASYVARGEADVGLGIEKVALQVKELDFIPLQKERYDLVIREEDAEKPQFKALLSVLRSRAFQNELQGMGGYDLTHTGEIMAET